VVSQNLQSYLFLSSHIPWAACFRQKIEKKWFIGLDQENC
jgi:hypothetical protein